MKKTILRLLALTIAVLSVILPLSACADRGTTLLSLSADGKTYTYSKNLYQLSLSAYKGQLVAAGATANGKSPADSAYWEIIDDLDGKRQTLTEYYSNAILEQCKYNLIALYLFDRYQLSLSQKDLDDIDKMLNELVQTDGGGSKNKLNSVLYDYGVNYDMMREHYTNSKRISALRSHLYSIIGKNIKQAYLEENYVHFHQIFLAKYKHVYVTDENGDVIYYDTANNNSVCYKKTEFFKQENGKTVYYTDATYQHISYDIEKGVPLDKVASDGTVITEDLTEEELTALEGRAELLWESLQGVDADTFEAMVAAEGEDDSAKAYLDGYYLKNDIDYSSSGEEYMYLDTLIDRLDGMKDGDVTLVESTFGWHVVMKYAHSDAAYEKQENEVWFESFESSLTEKVFREEADAYLGAIAVDESALSSAPDMKAVLPNYYYY